MTFLVVFWYSIEKATYLNFKFLTFLVIFVGLETFQVPRLKNETDHLLTGSFT